MHVVAVGGQATLSVFHTLMLDLGAPCTGSSTAGSMLEIHVGALFLAVLSAAPVLVPVMPGGGQPEPEHFTGTGVATAVNASGHALMGL